MKNKTWKLIIMIIVSIFIITMSYISNKQRIKELEVFYNSKLSPVIMIPGSSATENRFDKFVNKLNNQSVKKHSLLKVKAWNNGKITYRGKIVRGDNEPIIVVGFENNHDGYSNIKKQAEMFDTIFAELQSKYNFNNFKAIGHSNGGLIYTAFFENYFYKYDDVKVKKLMTIGTPYNFNENSIKNRTEMLADFIKNRDNIPQNLIVYSVAGTETYDSDGLVPEQSVAAGKYIYQKQVKHYTEITVTGSDAQHSDLPQNDEILSLIQRYMLDQWKFPTKHKKSKDDLINNLE